MYGRLTTIFNCPAAMWWQFHFAPSSHNPIIRTTWGLSMFLASLYKPRIGVLGELKYRGEKVQEKNRRFERGKKGKEKWENFYSREGEKSTVSEELRNCPLRICFTKSTLSWIPPSFVLRNWRCHSFNPQNICSIRPHVAIWWMVFCGLKQRHPARVPLA